MKTVLSEDLAKILTSYIADEDIELLLKDIKINGKVFGCKGFIRDKKTNLCVFVNTDNAAKQYTFRYAENIMDYQGLRHRYAKEISDMVKEIIDMLKDTHTFEVEKGCQGKW